MEDPCVAENDPPVNSRLQWRIAIRESDLDPTAKLVALTLDIYMNRRGIAWPLKSSLAAGSSCSVRTVDRALIRLERAGFVVVAHSKGKRLNLYCAATPEVIHNPVTGDAVDGELTPSPGTPTPSLATANPVTGDALSSKELVIRTGKADRARDQNQTQVDPAALELAHRWLAAHADPSDA